MVKNAKIIDEAKAHKAKTVQIGTTVVLQESNDPKEEYTIVGSTEANPLENRISNESPIGAAILGKKKGDSVEIKAPGGAFTVKILDLK